MTTHTPRMSVDRWIAVDAQDPLTPIVIWERRGAGPARIVARFVSTVDAAAHLDLPEGGAGA